MSISQAMSESCNQVKHGCVKSLYKTLFGIVKVYKWIGCTVVLFKSCVICFRLCFI